MLTTAARASTRRKPLLVSRSTTALGAVRNAWHAARAAAGLTPGQATTQPDASSRADVLAQLPGASTTSITSIPSGSAALSARPTSAGAQRQVSEMSRYSASLAAPVGAPPAYEIFGCGEKPAE